MKALILIGLFAVTSVSAAEVSKSDLVLRECLSKAYSNSNATTKEVNANAKNCRESVREMKRVERVAKKTKTLQERIAKAQAELKKIQ
jgi:peptidoglycan hydrolase CwlO-like protein